MNDIEDRLKSRKWHLRVVGQIHEASIVAVVSRHGPCNGRPTHDKQHGQDYDDHRQPGPQAFPSVKVAYQDRDVHQTRFSGHEESPVSVVSDNKTVVVLHLGHDMQGERLPGEEDEDDLSNSTKYLNVK